MTSKYSDTEILYVNLSAEAEALRMRAEANENRLESLLAKVEPPQPAPRSLIPTPSGSLNPSAPAKEELSPPKRPPKPQILLQHSIDTNVNIKNRMEAAEKLNLEWQSYNDDREEFVIDLTKKYHINFNELRQANEEICRLESREMKNNLRIKNLEAENLKLVDEIAKAHDLEVKNQRLNALLNMEKEKSSTYEQDLNLLNMKIIKLETANEKLVRALRKDRRKTDVSAIKLENSIYELTNKIDRMSTSSSANYSPTKLSPRKRNKEILTSPMRTNERRSVENTEISCENCGRKWPVSEHHKLLDHLDKCEDNLI